MGAFPAIRKAIAESTAPDAMRRRFHTWFDAFRTLKLLHALRDGGVGTLPWREALSEAPFTELASTTQDEPEEMRRALSERERSLAASPAGLGQNGKPIEM